MTKKLEKKIKQLERENRGLEKTLEGIKKELRKSLPKAGDIPEIHGLDIYGGVIPHNGDIGGDHLTYIDFNKRFDLAKRIEMAKTEGNYEKIKHLERNKKRAGILLADVSGHDISAAVMAGQLHQIALSCIRYDVIGTGETTPTFIEETNLRLYDTSAGLGQFATAFYAEISSDGRFRFIDAGQGKPWIYSYIQEKFVNIQDETIISSSPLGVLPTRNIDEKVYKNSIAYGDKYKTNERKMLATGDLIIISTDGLLDHKNVEGIPYLPNRFEQKLKKFKDKSAKDIFHAIKRDINNYAIREDDISYVVIKKT